MNEKELLCRMALPLLPGIGLVGARHLIQAAGSATMLFEHARELPAPFSIRKYSACAKPSSRLPRSTRFSA